MKTYTTREKNDIFTYKDEHKSTQDEIAGHFMKVWDKFFGRSTISEKQNLSGL